jgi:hypothetical protein
VSRRISTGRLGRRAFLGLGAAAAVSQFFPLSQSRAEDGGFPRRLVLLFSPNGTIYENWKPSGSGDAFTLKTILAPLEPFKDKLLIADGLRYAKGGAGNAHMQGPGKIWTGSALLAGDEFSGGGGATSGWGGGISIDQHIVNELSPPTKFGSLEFGVQTGSAQIRSRMSYAGSNQPIPPEDDPKAMYDRLFGDFGKDQAELEAARAERKSVIALLEKQLAVLGPRYGKDDALKIEAHLDALNEIEKRLDSSGVYPEACVPPVVGDFDVQANDNFPAVTKAQLDLLAMSLTCDMTRVASLMWNTATSGKRFTWLDIAEGHHDLSHEGDTNTTARTKLTKINTWYAQQVAYLMEKLDSVPEGDGTLLDNTLIVWGNELGKGNVHSHHPIPFVLAGGAAGHFQMGRSLDFGDTPHNRLLVSLCDYMGVSVTDFGDLDPGTGKLQGL